MHGKKGLQIIILIICLKINLTHSFCTLFEIFYFIFALFCFVLLCLALLCSMVQPILVSFWAQLWSENVNEFLSSLYSY